MRTAVALVCLPISLAPKKDVSCVYTCVFPLLSRAWAHGRQVCLLLLP